MPRFSKLLLLSISIAGCDGSLGLQPGNEKSSGDVPCTDRERCCPRDELVCTGDPDQQVVCRCTGLWDCSSDASKCEQPTPTPDGGGGWSCSWSAEEYLCIRPGGGDAPAAGKGWSCSAVGNTWRCTKSFPPNPTNNPTGGGAWVCRVDELHDELVCEKPGPASPPAPPSSPPGKTEVPPAAPVSPSTPKPGQECIPGQRRWCDGETYCGWGQQLCLASGLWEASCLELADGRRPSTLCACYHQTFDEACCETPDCILPAGTSGSLCTGYGGKLCDPCNPQLPGCTEPGAKCVVLASESFCGRGCSKQQPCPSGYLCIPEAGGGQCVPLSMSCVP